jgi:hypothetical protein
VSPTASKIGVYPGPVAPLKRFGSALRHLDNDLVAKHFAAIHYVALGIGIIFLTSGLLALAGLAARADVTLFLRWQAVIGALLGSAGTIFTGLLYYAAARHLKERVKERDARKLASQRAAAKSAAVLAINEPVHAAAATLAALRKAVASNQDAGSKQALADAISRLSATLQSLKTTTSGLHPKDRTLYVTIVTHFTSVANVAANPSGATSPDLRLKHFVRALESAHRYVAMFDAPLGRQFAEQSATG